MFHTEQLKKIIYIRIPLSFDFLQYGFWDYYLGVCNSHHLMRRRRVFEIRFRRLQRLVCTYFTETPKGTCQGSNDFPSRPARHGNGFAFNRLTCTHYDTAISATVCSQEKRTDMEYCNVMYIPLIVW